jgi:hypothetical protein
MTTADVVEDVRADLIAAEDWPFEPSDGQCTTGMYALHEPPDGIDADELRYRCFGDSRPEHPMNGVLAIDTSSCDPEWEVVEERWPQMYWPFEDRAPMWIGEHIVGTGTRSGRTWNWVDNT